MWKMLFWPLSFLAVFPAISPALEKDELPDLEPEISSAVKAVIPEMAVTSQHGVYLVRYKTRKYDIYTRQMNGEWSQTPETVDGPLRKGIVFYVVVSMGEYIRTLGRPRVLRLSPKTARRAPYFYESYSLVRWKDRHAIVDVAFGEGADLEDMEKVYRALLEVLESKFGKPEPPAKDGTDGTDYRKAEQEMKGRE
jgi:hypothetical protein